MKTRIHQVAVLVLAGLLAACGSKQSATEGSTGTTRPDARPTAQAAAPNASPAQAPAPAAAPTETIAEAEPAPEDAAPIVAPEDGTIEERLMYRMEEAVDRARRGNFEIAKVELLQLLREDQVAAYAAYNLGVIAYYEGQTGQALEYYEVALEQDPTFAPPLLATVRHHMAGGDTSVARDLVRRQLQNSENAPTVQGVELYLTLADGRYEQVIQDGRQVLIADAGNMDAHFTMAMAHYNLGRLELARYILEEGISRDEGRPDFYFALARIYLDRDEKIRARTYLERALEIDSSHPEASNNLGVLNLESRNFEAAEQLFRGAIERAPNYEEAWVNLGNALKGQQRYNEARDAYNRAMQMSPTYPAPYYNLGILFLDTEMDGLGEADRIQRALEYFSDFRTRYGAGLPAEHPVNTYQSEAVARLEVIRELEQSAQLEQEQDTRQPEQSNQEGGYADQACFDDFCVDDADPDQCYQDFCGGSGSDGGDSGTPASYPDQGCFEEFCEGEMDEAQCYEDFCGGSDDEDTESSDGGGYEDQQCFDDFCAGDADPDQCYRDFCE